MGISAAALEKLASLGLSTDQMAGVLGLLADIQRSDEERRAKQRARTQRSRAGNATVTLQQRVGNSDSDPRAPVHSLEEVIPPSPPKGGSSPKSKPKKTRIPDDWRPSEKNRDDALRIGLTVADIEREWPKFLDRQKAQAAMYADWDAAWRSWCRKVPEFSKQRESNGRPVKRTMASTMLDALRASGNGGRSDGFPEPSVFLLPGSRN